MENRLMECFTHPVKCKLLMEIYGKGTATAKQLAHIFTDIPQATLYRYLKRMTADGVLKIVGETPIRGTVERTYAVAIDLAAAQGRLLEEEPGEALMVMFMQYMAGFMKQFSGYCKREDIDLERDMPTFSLAPVYATREELETALLGMGKALEPLLANKPGEGRQLRTFGVLLAPPEPEK